MKLRSQLIDKIKFEYLRCIHQNLGDWRVSDGVKPYSNL